MKKLITFPIVSVLLGCHAGSPDASLEQTIAELVASQSSGYAVPATAGGTSFTVAASMGSVRWAVLDEAQLRAWWALWSAMRDDPARPRQQYLDERGAPADLFERSARDGFCVAFARKTAGELQEPRLVAFFDGL